MVIIFVWLIVVIPGVKGNVVGVIFFLTHKLTPPVPGSMLPFSKCQLFPLSQYPMGQKYKVPDRVFCNLSVNRLVCQGLKLKF